MKSVVGFARGTVYLMACWPTAEMESRDWMAQEMWNTHISGTARSRDPHCAAPEIKRELEDLKGRALLCLMISIVEGSPLKRARANSVLLLWRGRLARVKIQIPPGEVVALY